MYCRCTKSIVYTDKNGKQVSSKFDIIDIIVTACDVPGIQKLLPQPWRKDPFLDNIYSLSAVPVTTVQLRFNDWVTELQDAEKMKEINGDLSDGKAAGIDTYYILLMQIIPALRI